MKTISLNPSKPKNPYKKSLGEKKFSPKVVPVKKGKGSKYKRDKGKIDV